AAGCRHTIRLLEQNLFDFRLSAAPLGNFQARAEFWFCVIKRMSKETREERSAAGAFHKLCGPRQEAEGDAHESRVRDVAGSDGSQELRSGSECGARKFFLSAVGNNFIQPANMAEFLDEKRVKVFRCKLLEEIVQPIRESPTRKTRCRRAFFQRQLPEQIIG